MGASTAFDDGRPHTDIDTYLQPSSRNARVRGRASQRHQEHETIPECEEDEDEGSGLEADVENGAA